MTGTTKITTWVPDGTGVQDGGDVGGDAQCTKAYSVRFFRQEDGRDGRIDFEGDTLYSVLTLNFYGEMRVNSDGEPEPDSDGNLVIWMNFQSVTHVCNDRNDVGGTEVECYQYDDKTDRFFTTTEVADEACNNFAKNYTAELANRDIGWNGLAAWELEVAQP